jgi:integrase
MKLTAKSIAGLELPAGKRDHIEFDDDIPGFGLRLREGGSRVWIYQYKLGSKQRRIALAKVAALKPEKARDLAGELHAKVRLGGDPAAQKAEGKARAADSLEGLIRRYLQHRQHELRPRSLVEVTRHLEVYAKPLHKLPLTTIDRRAVAERLSDVAKNSGAVTANRVRASLGTMFTWAAREGLAESNPVANTNKHEEKSRDRVLSYGELALIWNALEDDDYGAVIKLLMLTGQRANEIAGLRWSEVLDDMIDLPGERTKNGRSHFVPLSAPARAILDAQPRRRNPDGRPRELVFGSGSGPFSGWSNCKERLDARIREMQRAVAEKAGRDSEDIKPLPHWVPHDLRRTMVTKMADDLKVLPHVIEATINHVSGHKGGVAGIYNKATYLAERNQALAMWGEHLLTAIEGRQRKVVPLQVHA